MRQAADRASLRILVVDDETPGRLRIEDLLAREPDAEVVASVEDGASAVAEIQAKRPSLVFLDVQMPGMSGLDVARTLGSEMPPTVFVTAFERHAVEAFGLSAVDYLVKPFDDERFGQALARARRLIGLERAGRLQERFVALLSGGDTELAPHSPPSRYVDRIPVEAKGQTRFVLVDQIDAIVASGRYAELVVGERRYLLRETMKTLEECLDPARFLRIHRSTIVAVNRVVALHRGSGDTQVKLKSGARLTVSRPRRAIVEARLGFPL